MVAGMSMNVTPPPGVRAFDALFSETGILWAINRQVFHPRGFALALHRDDHGHLVGWSIEGDGAEPWRFDDEAAERACFLAFERLLAGLARVGR